MNKVEQAIRQFRASEKNEQLFLEAQAEIQLSERMAELRHQAGLTQAELAKRLGVSQAYIAKLESGGYDRCGIGTLRSIASALGHDIDIEAMFVPSHCGYAASAAHQPIILHTASHSTDSLSKKVVSLDEWADRREAAVG